MVYYTKLEPEFIEIGDFDFVSPAFKAGALAAKNNVPRIFNPYREGVVELHNWDYGYRSYVEYLITS